jgi:homeobox protein cut-like
MERKLASLDLELRAERAGSEATQTSLLEADEGLNEREAVWEAQRQILFDDADRLREQLHEVKRERDTLKIKAEAMKEDPTSSKSKEVELSTMQMADIMAERKAYESEVSELTLAITTMRDEIRQKEDTTGNLQA